MQNDQAISEVGDGLLKAMLEAMSHGREGRQYIVTYIHESGVAITGSVRARKIT